MVSEVPFMPFLPDNIQFRKITKEQVPFAIEEMQLRTSTVSSNEYKKSGMWKLVKRLKEIVHPPSENSLANEEIEEQKFFMFVCSRASE